jgi:hypothetical protein
VLARDTSCVYCDVAFSSNIRNMASWEHINNRAVDIEPWNIVLCCRSCNSSKGAKSLSEWLSTKYCIDKNITPKTVAPIIQKYIQEGRM